MQQVSPPWRIEMLGGLRIVRASQEEAVEFLAQQPSALLAYLALHPQRAHTREELAERLWPEEAGEAVQKKMRNSLHLLRQRFKQPPLDQADFLRINRQTFGLDPALVGTDVQDFKDALSAAAGATDLKVRQQYLAQAVQLYRGDLLPGFYQDCFLSERNRLSDLYASALHLLTQVYEQTGDLERAIECARRTVELDPLMEEAHCTLMRLFAEMGQPSAVIKQYQELERVLKEAFGEEPSSATRQLMETLRERAQANVPRTVNGKADQPYPTQEGAREAVRSARSSASLDALSSPVSTPLPARSASSHRRRSLVMGAIGILALLAALGTVFLHHRTAPPKSRLPVPDAKRIWVAHVPPASDEKANSQPTAMTTDAVGNIYITGFVQTLHNDVDFLTLKYDPNGKLLWHKRYNGPGNDVDRARSIALDKDGNVYVTGDSDNGKGNGLSRLSGLDWATIKYGPDGKPSPTWPDVGFGVGVRRYNGPDNDEDMPVKVCVDGQGNVYVAGGSNGLLPDSVPRTDYPNWAVVKYDAQGRQVWVRHQSLAEGRVGADVADMVLDPAGNIYITGGYNTSRAGIIKGELYIMKYAPNGDLSWRKNYHVNGYGNVYCHRMALDGANNVYVTGAQFDGDLVNNGSLKDVVTLKYDDDGNEKWNRVYDHALQDDSPNALTVDAAGNVCVVGETGPLEKRDYLIVRYDPDGNLQWAGAYNGTANGQDYAWDVAFDPAGNAIVTGYATSAIIDRHAGMDSEPSYREDGVTIKYDPTGRPLWKGVYNDGARWGTDRCLVTIDNQNNVIVAGQSDEGKSDPVITIIKYAAEAGP